VQSDNDKVVAELREMQKVFEEPGWRIVVNQLLQSAEELKEAVLYSKDWGETQFLKGRVEQCRMAANLEDLVLNQLAMIEEEALGGDDAADV
jgi:hypothetical protein